jgi:hypothetical protein
MNAQEIADASLYNFVILLLISSKDKNILIEYKVPLEFNESDEMTMLDNQTREILKDIRLSGKTKYDKPIPHINNTPISMDIFPKVMAILGNVYSMDRNELKTKEITNLV